MIKKSIMLCLTFLALGCMTWASAKSWTGTVSDEHCGTKHANASDAATACVKKCADGGSKYVLVSKGHVYKLEPQDKFADHAGHHVKVTGDMKDGTITATDVDMIASSGTMK